MTEAPLTPSVDEPEDTFLRNIHRLFFRPKAYFERITAPKKRIWLWLFALTYSLAHAIDRAARSDPNGSLAATTWAEHWGIVAGAGLFGMLIVYAIGGWWYGFRLGVCGVHPDDNKLIKLVYLSSAQIYAVPLIIMDIFSTFRFPDPAAAALGEPGWLTGLSLLFLVWSYIASYVGVRTVFQASKRCAMTWFLILPILFLVVVIGGAAYLVSLGSGPGDSSVSDIPKAQVSAPLEYAGSDIAFSYPGNWTLTDSGESPEAKVEIEIDGEGSTYFLLMRIEATDSPEVLVDRWVESMKESVSVAAEPEPFEAWAAFKGAGRRFEAQSENALDEVRLFIAPLDAGQVLMICEILPSAAKGKVEPGFKLIRESFRMKS